MNLIQKIKLLMFLVLLFVQEIVELFSNQERIFNFEYNFVNSKNKQNNLIQNIVDDTVEVENAITSCGCLKIYGACQRVNTDMYT